ncbi:MAG: cation diffusion facilitator family transporter [Magnetospirillum sp. WYHS-4]
MGAFGVLTGSSAMSAYGLRAAAGFLTKGSSRAGLDVASRLFPKKSRIETAKLLHFLAVLIGAGLAGGAILVSFLSLRDIGDGVLDVPSELSVLGVVLGIATFVLMRRYEKCVDQHDGCSVPSSASLDEKMDAFVSSVALLGIVLAFLGWPIADRVAAILVSLAVLRTGVMAAYRGLTSLTDMGASSADADSVWADESMSDRKESVALSSVFASAFMAAMKLVVGLMTGSLGILSEAAHSFMDLGAASLTWFAVRAGDKPPDEEHPFGHGKIESISALIETGLLFLTCAWILREAVARLMTDAVEVKTTWYAVAVIVVSIVIDVNRSRALLKVAKETGSKALEADALHFSSDVWSSAVVLLGLGFVAIGWEKGDAIAAIGVAGFVFLAGYRLAMRTVDVLIDTAPEGVADDVAKLVAAYPGVARIERVRARPAGTYVYVEVVVKVNRGLPLERVQDIRNNLHALITSELPDVDPLVVVEPLTLDNEDVAETIRIAAANHNLGVHNIDIHAVGEHRHIGFDLEVDGRLGIREAHDVASALEDRLIQELGGNVSIDIHIDPRRSHVLNGELVAADELERARVLVTKVVGSFAVVRRGQLVTMLRGPDGIYVAVHCTFPNDVPMDAVRDTTAKIEHDLRKRISGVSRVVVHAEPEARGDDETPPSATAGELERV